MKSLPLVIAKQKTTLELLDLNIQKMLFYNGTWYDKVPKEVIEEIKTKYPGQWLAINKKHKLEKTKKHESISK